MKYQTYERRGLKVVIPEPENFADRMTLAQSDLFRIYGRRLSLTKMIFSLQPHPRFFLCFRLASMRGLTGLVAKVFHRLHCSKRNIELPPETKAGYGLYLGHLQSLVIHPSAIIGNNVNLSQFSTIGSTRGHAAMIGDNVYIGPSVCVVEDVAIGSCSTIGAGAVVNRDVAPSTSNAGVPSHKISDTARSEFIINPWPTDNNN